MAKFNRPRKKGGWANTKKYPHERHPANYVRKVGDTIEYLTFTHSPEVEYDKAKISENVINALLSGVPTGHIRKGDNGKYYVRTIPMADNVSKKEREANKQKGLKQGEYRSYAYPVVFVGTRNALHSEIVGEFEPVPFDKARIETMFKILPRKNVPVTGGKGQYKKQNGIKKPPK